MEMTPHRRGDMKLVIQDGDNVLKADIEDGRLLVEQLTTDPDSGGWVLQNKVVLDNQIYPKVGDIERSFRLAAEQLSILLHMGDSDSGS